MLTHNTITGVAPKLFPLADWPILDELEALGISRLPVTKSNIRAIWTGEKRCPKKGEWYLSGAIIEAYRAPNDLSAPYPIAKLVKVKQVTIIDD